MRLLLIRHGQTQSHVDKLLDTAHPGAPLTELGRQQAADLVESIAGEPIEAVYASTLTRAQETAAPLAQTLGLEVQVRDGLQEIPAGEDEMSADWARYVGVLNRWSPENLDEAVPGGETARQFVTRYNDAISHIEADEHECVAVVSHGAAIRVWALTQAPHVPQETARALHNTEWLVFEGSTESGWTLLRWADIDL